MYILPYCYWPVYWIHHLSFSTVFFKYLWCFQIYLLFRTQEIHLLLFFSVDGNTDLTSICRMVNDAHRQPNKNAVMKIIGDVNDLHLCLFALRDIKENAEIRYDYGNTEAPWRKAIHKVCLYFILPSIYNMDTFWLLDYLKMITWIPCKITKSLLAAGLIHLFLW